MRQLIQNLKTGETILEEVPVPQPSLGQLLIQTTRSLVSLGTERMLVEFGKANLFQKARQQPDKVRQVIDKVKTDGLFPTLENVMKRLDEPLPLGYCNVGVVVDVRRDGEKKVRRAEGEKIGDAEEQKFRREEDEKQKYGDRGDGLSSDLLNFSTSSFAIGDRVASNGKHAEYVSVPENLCARIPDNVSDDEAALTVVGSYCPSGCPALQSHIR
jgi:hypothetical protein